MNLISSVKELLKRAGFGRNSTVAGIDNLTKLANQRLMELVEGSKNQSDLLNRKLGEIVAGLDNQSCLLATKLDKLIAGLDNQSDLLNRKLAAIAEQLVGPDKGKKGGVGGGEPNRARAPRFEEPPENTGIFKQASSAPPISGSHNGARASIRGRDINDLAAYADVFAGIEAWQGTVPRGYVVDFLGTLTDVKFNAIWFSNPSLNSGAFNPGFEPSKFGGRYFETSLPHLAEPSNPGTNGEGWLEAVDWVEAARDARGRYVMITLGANYGAQAVSAYRALQAVNPLPYKLVAVEPEPGNIAWMRQHMSDNGIDPDQQWIVPAAVSDKAEPLFFPMGGTGTGANNCYSTNEPAARQQYAEQFIANGTANQALRNLLVNNSTGLTKDLVPGHGFEAEIKLISSITLNELLGPFDAVDLLESDIQQSEILVFPPFVDLLRRKVRRIHIGTHGQDVHAALHTLFAENGWEIVFSFRPNATHDSALGTFSTNDGVLTVRNPDL